MIQYAIYTPDGEFLYRVDGEGVATAKAKSMNGFVLEETWVVHSSRKVADFTDQ